MKWKHKLHLVILLQQAQVTIGCDNRSGSERGLPNSSTLQIRRGNLLAYVNTGLHFDTQSHASIYLFLQGALWQVKSTVLFQDINLISIYFLYTLLYMLFMTLYLPGPPWSSWAQRVVRPSRRSATVRSAGQLRLLEGWRCSKDYQTTNWGACPSPCLPSRSCDGFPVIWK
jgi:hypothetical protein